jgi:predicted TIM-barrel fold metal-dependent hydrolase
LIRLPGNEQGEGLIDIHCHTAGIGTGGSGCFVSQGLRSSFRYRFYLKAFGVTERELLTVGDGLIMQRISQALARSRRVSAAVILALDGVAARDGELDEAATEIYIPNEFVANEVRRYPNLLFGASINPLRRDALRRLEEVAADGAVLVKWLPPIQHIDPADQELVPFYLRLKELGLPLLSHTGSEHSFTRAHNEFGDPERLRLPLSLGVTVIAAHGAGSGRNQGEANFERLFRLRDYPNFFVDISALTQLNRPGQLTRLLQCREFHGRLLYGTDMPLVNSVLVSPLAFLYRLPLRQLIGITRIQNCWDRDLTLKERLGLRDEMLADAGKILKMPTGRDAGCRGQ